MNEDTKWRKHNLTFIIFNLSRSENCYLASQKYHHQNNQIWDKKSPVDWYDVRLYLLVTLMYCVPCCGTATATVLSYLRLNLMWQWPGLLYSYPGPRSRMTCQPCHTIPSHTITWHYVCLGVRFSPFSQQLYIQLSSLLQHKNKHKTIATML